MDFKSRIIYNRTKVVVVVFPDGSTWIERMLTNKLKRGITMTKKEIFEKLVELQKLVWTDDDRMDQDNLFELQDKMAQLVLDLANDTNNQEVILKEFSWIYK